MISFDDITVVVQGPVQTFKDRPQEENITNKCLLSVREWLPGAKIILSTWENQDLEGLDYDELVISQDPGPNCRNYTMKGTAQYYNNNRQIVSSLAGLKRVKTRYALKLRSDNFLTSNDFVSLQQAYTERSQEYKYLEERVVVCNVFTRKYAKGYPVAFHLSDFFYFGLTKDVLAFWDIALFKEFVAKDAGVINDGFPDYVVDCTQAFFLEAMSKFDASIKLKSMLDNDPAKIEQSVRCYANNLVIAEPEMLGLGLCQKFLGKARVSRAKGKSSHYQFFEWLELYKQYCDSTVDTSHYRFAKFKLWLQRIYYVFPARIETSIKLLKRKRMLNKIESDKS